MAGFPAIFAPMCLILFAHQVHPRFPLIIAANRDEFFARPTLPAHHWPNFPGVVAGKDQKQGGTWLGVSTQGRWAALTNYRNPATERQNSPSRGQLVLDFLRADENPQAFLEKISLLAPEYSGYNLLTGDFSAIYYQGNQMQGVEKVAPGIHGLSNALLDTPWWKVEQGKAGLEALVSAPDFAPQTHADAIFSLLRSPAQAPPERLPHTGVAPAWEQLLSSMFIQTEQYGTRCSTLLAADAAGNIYFEERTWYPAESRFVTTFQLGDTTA